MLFRSDPAHAKALADMRARLNKWMRETNDPALKGEVKASEGAVINDVDGTSPKERTRPA